MDLLHTILKDDIKKASEERRALRKKLKAERQRKSRIKTIRFEITKDYDGEEIITCFTNSEWDRSSSKKWYEYSTQIIDILKVGYTDQHKKIKNLLDE